MYKLIRLIAIGMIVVNFSGCAAERTSNRCLTYTASGDTSVSWAPIQYYQAESPDILYIEIPQTTNYVPILEVVDTEFDQPYKIDYTYDEKTFKFKVQDNHDQYLLYRDSPDGLEKDKVYITCNHQAK